MSIEKPNSEKQNNTPLTNEEYLKFEESQTKVCKIKKE
jgi:hypothetical protein